MLCENSVSLPCSIEQRPCRPSNITSPVPAWYSSAFSSCRSWSCQSTFIHPLHMFHSAWQDKIVVNWSCQGVFVEFELEMSEWICEREHLFSLSFVCDLRPHVLSVYFRTAVLGISFGMSFLILSVILLICFIGHFLVSASGVYNVYFVNTVNTVLARVGSLVHFTQDNYIKLGT